MPKIEIQVTERVTYTQIVEICEENMASLLRGEDDPSYPAIIDGLAMDLADQLPGPSAETGISLSVEDRTLSQWSQVGEES